MLAKATYRVARIARAREAGNWALVAAEWTDLLARQPASVRALGAQRLARTVDEARLVEALAAFHQAQASALTRAGDDGRAARVRGRVKELTAAVRPPEGSRQPSPGGG